MFDFATLDLPQFQQFTRSLIGTMEREAEKAGCLVTGDLDATIEKLVSQKPSYVLKLFDAVIHSVFKTEQAPLNRSGDAAIALCNFVYVHKRMPRRELLIYDVMYHLKTSGELLNPERIFTTDKELAKIYLAALVGDQFNVPTLAVLRDAEEVDAFEFPSDAVIKPTHLTKSVIIPANGDVVDRAVIKKWFARNHYGETREANYATLVPKVIVEPFLRDHYELKVFCYRGRPRFIQAALGGLNDMTLNYFDAQWNELDITGLIKRRYPAPPRPAPLDQGLRIAEKIAQRFNFVRVDLYINDSSVYAGEITHCHNSGLSVFRLPSDHTELSALLFAD